MIRSLKAAALFAGALVAGALLGAASPLPHAYADAFEKAGAAPLRASQAQEPFDPKKKKAGDTCKSSDECQNHHSCVKVGDKSVCQAPPSPQLSPGAVT